MTDGTCCTPAALLYKSIGGTMLSSYCPTGVGGIYDTRFFFKLYAYMYIYTLIRVTAPRLLVKVTSLFSLLGDKFRAVGTRHYIHINIFFFCRVCATSNTDIDFIPVNHEL